MLSVFLEKIPVLPFQLNITDLLKKVLHKRTIRK